MKSNSTILVLSKLVQGLYNPPNARGSFGYTYQEPNADLREQFRKKREEIGTPETEMACWLLEALAKEAVGHAARVMYKRSTLASLTRCDCVE